MMLNDSFGRTYDDAAAHIKLHNGRVFQIPLLDENGNRQVDGNGFLAVDIDATFAAQHEWIAAHPEEWYPFPGQLDRAGTPIILDWVSDAAGNWYVDPSPHVFPPAGPEPTE